MALKRGTNVMAFWLDGSTLIGPNFSGGGPVGLWKYPVGGSPIKTISGTQEPFAATLTPEATATNSSSPRVAVKTEILCQ